MKKFIIALKAGLLVSGGANFLAVAFWAVVFAVGIRPIPTSISSGGFIAVAVVTAILGTSCFWKYHKDEYGG